MSRDLKALRAPNWARGWDMVLAVGVLVFSLLVQGIGAGLPWFEVLVPLALCVCWLGRRRWPVGVLGTMVVVGVAQVLLGMDLIAADVMFVAGVHNVASRRRWQTSVPLAALVAVGVLIATRPMFVDGYLNIGDVGLLVLLVITSWTVGSLVRVRRLRMEALEERARQLEREKETQRQIVAAAERARIAREIHDVVSHSLSSVVLLTDGAAHKVRTEPDRAREAMHLARDTARSALGEMRRTLDLLREDDGPTSRTPQPGVDDLPGLVAATTAMGTPTELAVRGERVPLSEGVDLAVHRIVQESLTNARKHGGPTLAGVLVEVTWPDATESGELVVRITDDGAGDVGESTGLDGGGHGLVGMRERVKTFGGTLYARPRNGGGYRVEARIPADELDPDPSPDPEEQT